MGYDEPRPVWTSLTTTHSKRLGSSSKTSGLDSISHENTSHVGKWPGRGVYVGGSLMGDLALLIMIKDVRCVIHHPRVESGPGLTRILMILRCRGTLAPGAAGPGNLNRGPLVA